MKRNYQGRQPYNMSPQSYVVSQNVTVGENVNGFLAVNTGDTKVWVGGMPLNPRLAAGTSGESFGALGNAGECYIGDNHALKIVFESGGAAPEVIIVWKFYTQ